MAPSWSKSGQHSHKLAQPRPKMRLLQTLRMGHRHRHHNNSNSNNNNNKSFTLILYNLFMILFPHVGPWPAVGRKPLNKVFQWDPA